MIKDLRKKNTEEISKMISEKRAELSKFRFDVSGSKVKNVKTGRNLRKEISQMLTVVKEMSK